MSAIQDARDAFQKWLYLPDPSVVDVALGAVAANLLDGRPVWLMLVGAPGSGKTEVLNALAKLPNVYHAASITEASLLSGTPKRDKAADARGGLLRAVGDFGILILKDFTSILAMNRDSRAGVLAALREIYDGAWTRHVGTDGGRELHWEGKLGLVGGVTPIIDSHHGVMASMGERFLLFRLPQSDPELQALRAMENQRHIGRMTRDLAEAVRGLFAGGLDPERPERTSMGEVGRLVALATIAAQARSAVERDGRTREVELVPDAEMPARLTVGLAQLDDGMAAIGVPAGDRWRHVCKVALDCIPSIRRRILARLIEHGTAMSTADIAEALDYPTTTARRALEDLTCHHVLMRVKTGQGGADLWTVGKVTLERWESAGVPVGILGTVPEMSEVAA